MPGGVGEPGSVGEKVSAPHRQPSVCLCVHSVFLWCWICNFAGRVMMVTLETRGPSDSMVLLWAELPPFLLPSSSCSSFPCLFIACQLICITVRVLKGMSVRRGTLAFLELLGLLDLEEYREKMDLKAPLWVIHRFLGNTTQLMGFNSGFFSPQGPIGFPGDPGPPGEPGDNVSKIISSFACYSSVYQRIVTFFPMFRG